VGIGSAMGARLRSAGMRASGLALVQVLVLVIFSPFTARAQSETEVALADALYRQARDLMAAGNYDEACPKLAESHRLDRATGTLLNLAACHERQGKLASAWLEFSDALPAARRDGRPDRAQFAEDHLTDLEPKLSHLTLSVPTDADDPNLELALDGILIGRAARGVPAPVDPGHHVVVAKAPGKQTWSQSIEIGLIADQETVTIPKLEDAPASVVAPNAAAVPSAPEGRPPAAIPAHDEFTTRPVPVSVFAAGVTTLVLATVASATSAVYLDHRASYSAELRVNGGSPAPSPKAKESYDSAVTWGLVNAGLWTTTACGAALTTYLYLTRPERHSSRPKAARLLPWALPTSAGLAVSGGF
jgi:hypothetical protein